MKGILENKKILIPIATIILAVIILGVSYAYFSANLIENNKTESVIQTKELKIAFDGTQEIEALNITPGWSAEKKFTVENLTNSKTAFNIYLQNITNEFDNELIYSLYETDSTGNVIETLVDKEVLPQTNADKSYLQSDIELNAQPTKKYYTLKIEFEYKDTPQNEYQGAHFRATVGVDAASRKDVGVIGDKIDASSITNGDSVTKQFNVMNFSSESKDYNLKLSDVVNTYASGLKYSLKKNGVEVVSSTTMPTTDATLLSYQTIAAGAKDIYEMTITYDTTQANADGFRLLANEVNTFTANIKVNGVRVYKEDILNGAVPNITSDLVPVTIETDGTKVTVKKANTYSEWYNYSDHKWANAVILNKTDTYEAGDTINQSDIESYFVWIPRYKYKLWNANQADGYTSATPSNVGSDARQIEIVFENKDTQASNGSNNGEWLTHPAFTSFDVNGIWVGKYETTGNSSKLTVLPNTTSFKNQTVKTFFELAKNYKTNSDSHMMKNTEWGAVAYLYHSKYGRCTNGTCEDIRINNNSSYVTGYAAVDGTDQSSYPGTYGTGYSSKTLLYYTTTGVKASTTGNITGVYDISGGAWEYMAAYRTGTYGSSGFDASSIGNYNAKYFDVYGNSEWTSYSMRILGDATGEMGSFYYYTDSDGNNRIHNNWYADASHFVRSSDPWFIRGGGYIHGAIAGAFSFSYNAGGANVGIGFRLVLAK